MTSTPEIAPIRASVVVDVSPEDAFAGFTDGMSTWWPHSATWSGELLERIGIEPRRGGLCFEIGANGMRFDWGRVAAWEPPSRVAFSWHVGPDRVPDPNPAHASQVDVRFEPADDGRTQVTLTHDGWERHGERGAAYREQFDQARGWPVILESYAAAVQRRGDAPWSGLST